ARGGAAARRPGGGAGHRLFAGGLIPSMSRKDMQTVYRLLKEERERGEIPWEWIVDETRDLERVATWDDPGGFARTMVNACRHDNWNQQPRRVEVRSEQGTSRGVLKPELAKA